MKNVVVLIEDDVKREKKLTEHKRVAKCMKTEIQTRENKIGEIETELVREALKLPNKTHVDSPVGDESKNRLVKQVDKCNTSLP